MNKIVLIVAFALSLMASTQEYQVVYEKYESGAYTQALQEFQRLATQENDYDAAYMLGYMYDNAQGCAQDKDEARKWYIFSASGFHKKSNYKIDSDIEKIRMSS
ncbi:MAG: hypothetical protein PHU40_12255 [Sulfurimonas sp.]|nr:hypothetical protein [Sulfurimonas sp.]